MQIELVTITGVLGMAAALAYRSSFLHNKRIGYISILQIFYLIVVPGFIYTAVFNYILEVMARPLSDRILVKDELVVSLLLLSILYTYGGLAIHSIGRTLTEHFVRTKTTDLFVYEVNQYFHRPFSHNLVFIGAMVSAACLSLLELNHVSPYPAGTRLMTILLNGTFVGIASVLSLYSYKHRWLELRLFFFSVWVLGTVVLYAIKPYIKDAEQYPFTLMILVAFSMLAVLSMFLYVRRYKDRLRLIWRIPWELFN